MEIKQFGNPAGKKLMLFAESLGCGPAIFWEASSQVQVRRMILSGPEYLDFGILNKPLLSIMPQKQYRTAHEKAIQKLRIMYPRLTVRCFSGFGHGDIINHPDLLAAEMEAFLNSADQ